MGIAAAMLGALAASAPGMAQAETAPSVGVVQQLTLDATDFAFEWPESVSAGWTAIEFVNDGAEPHHAQLMRLNEGVTPADIEQAAAVLEEEPEALFSLVTLAGGPGIIVPGASQGLILDLAPGSYLWLCGIPAADGQPHFMKGMVQAFEVVEAAPEGQPEERSADLVVGLQDFAFDVGDGVAAGPQRWLISNDGTQPHEILLARLEPGATAMEFVETAFDPSASGPPPGVPVGGMQALMPGTSGWLELDLEPGTYAAVCFVPDPESGQPHLALGMLTEFTVAA